MWNQAFIWILFIVFFSGCHLNNDRKDSVSKDFSSSPQAVSQTKVSSKKIANKNVIRKNAYMDKQASELKRRINKAKDSRDGEDIKIIFNSGISFDSNSDQITPSGKKNIDKLSEILNKYPTTKVAISGHTDNTGSNEYNRQLSKKRADAVAKYAASKGIQTNRFTVTGFGEEKPIADNNTDKGKKINRRVEITIISDTKENSQLVGQIQNKVDSNCYCTYDENNNFICKRLCDSWEKVPVFSRKSIHDDNSIDVIASNNKNLKFNNLINLKSFTNHELDAIIVLTGKVYDAKTKKPIEAEIIFETLPDGSRVGITKSDREGHYELALRKERHYGYMAQAKGYLSVHENIKIPQMRGYAEIRQNLYLVPIESGLQIKLNNVFFVQSKALLLSSSYPELNEVIKFLKNNPKVVIELHGHTDANGDPEINYMLSKKRVAEIKKYLVSKNISPERVQLKAFGDTKPIASNEQEETRKLNRRVEFIIVKK